MPELHDEYGCSRHDGLIACLKYKSGPSGPAAREGSQMHSVAEQIIKARWKSIKWPELFETGKVFGVEHRAIVLTYTNAIRDLYEGYRKQYGDEVQLLVEKEIKIPELGIELSTIDVLIYVPFILIHIVDLKTGKTFVSEHSAQMKGYLLGAMNAGPATKLISSICQPPISDELRTVERSGLELEKHTKMMKLVLAAAKRADPPSTPCKYCGFCIFNGICTATKSKLAILSTSAENYEVSRETLAILTAYSMDIKIIINSLKQRAVAILSGGDRLPLPGGRELMIKAGKNARFWYDDRAAADKLIPLIMAKLECTADEAEDELWVTPKPKPKKFISVSGAEKIVGKSKRVAEAIGSLIGTQPTEPKEKTLIVVKTTEGESI